MNGVFEHCHVTHGGYRGKEGRQEQEHILPQHREGFADCRILPRRLPLYLYSVRAYVSGLATKWGGGVDLGCNMGIREGLVV